jgi:hypothetical protein
MFNNEVDKVHKVYKVCKVHKVARFMVPHLQWGSLFDLWDKGILPERLAVVTGVTTFVVGV